MPTRYELCNFLLIRPDVSDETIIKRICQVLGRDEEELKAAARQTIVKMEKQIKEIKKRFDIH